MSLKGLKSNIPLLPCSGQDRLGLWRDDLRRGTDKHHSMLPPEIWKHIVCFIFLDSLGTQTIAT